MVMYLKEFLDRHHRSITKKQAQQMFLYIAFVLRFCNKYNKNFNEYSELEGLLPHFFKKVIGYEIKEAAFEFNNYMPWEILNQNSRINENLYEIACDIYKNENTDSEWLMCQAKALLSFDTDEEIIITPPEVCSLVSKLAGLKEAEQIIDICCGTFLLGLSVWNEMGNSAFCYGEDINKYMCIVSRLLLFLCDVNKFSVSESDILRDCLPENLEKASRVFVADLPLVGNRTIPVPPEIEVFSGNKRTLYADWMMTYNVLKQLNTGDRAFVIVTKGALVRENEGFLRKYLIENDLLDAAVSLPIGIYTNHNLPMELLICEKGRTTDRSGKVLFADLSKFKALNNDTISSLSEIYQKYDSANNLTRIVRAEEIKEKEYVLYPQIYMEDEKVSGGQLRLGDVASVIRGLQEFSSYKTLRFEERYFLNVRDIQNGEIIYDTAEKIEIGNLQWEKKFRIREDDIIITARGASLKIAIVPPNPLPAYISGNLMIIRTDSKKYSPYILYEYLMSEKGQHILSLIQTGTTIRILGTKKTEQIVIPSYDSFEHSVTGEMLKVLRLKYRMKLQEINSEYNSNRKKIISKLGFEEENTNE